MCITIANSLDGITAERIADGFFDGWPQPPSRQTPLAVLEGSRAACRSTSASASREAIR
jgi:hypothetical protein